MKKVLYVLNDCMRKFSYERATGLYNALKALDEPFTLCVLRSDAYNGFAPEHNLGEYCIYRLPDYNEFDGILLDVNSIFGADANAYGAMGMENLVRSAAASGKPVISMANHIPGFHYVGIDNSAAMASVIRHLHERHGLTDFWYALGPADNFENQSRARGLMDYCAAHGLPWDEARVYAESFIIECGMHAFDALLARHGGVLPQAVICANDHIAMGVCYAAKAAGYRVPEDFLVTGFDNIDLSNSFSPPITSVDQQCWNMGDACVDVLRRIWAGEDVPEVIHTPAKLVLRESTERTTVATRELLHGASDYIGSSTSNTDFNYKMSAMQYRLPGCKTIEEICTALTECLDPLTCDGLELVMDSRLFDSDRMLSFTNRTGQLFDASEGLCVGGYPDTLERVFVWEKGKAPQFPRERVGSALSGMPGPELRANCLYAPLHFMEHTVGYLGIRSCLHLMRIKGVSAVVSTLTMALRNYFSARSLSYINRVLSGVSMQDGLTGLYNRLGYHELAYPLFRDVTESGGRLAILFLDMDRLKFINDVYGHGAGDRAIQCVAEAIRQSAPEDAIPVRYGGDEFLVLMPCEGEDEAERLRDAIVAAALERAREMNLPEAPGVSAGYVLAEPDGIKTLDDCVQEADQLMYRAKKAKKVQRGE